MNKILSCFVSFMVLMCFFGSYFSILKVQNALTNTANVDLPSQKLLPQKDLSILANDNQQSNISAIDFEDVLKNILKHINDTDAPQIEEPVDHSNATIPEYQKKWNEFIKKHTKLNDIENYFVNDVLNPDLIIQDDKKFFLLLNEVQNANTHLGVFENMTDLQNYYEGLAAYYFVKKIPETRHIKDLLENKQEPDSEAEEIAESFKKHANYEACKQTLTYLNKTESHIDCHDEYIDEPMTTVKIDTNEDAKI